LPKAKSLVGDDRFSSIARLKAIGFFGMTENFGDPKIGAYISKPLISPACARPECRRMTAGHRAGRILSATRRSGLSERKDADFNAEC